MLNIDMIQHRQDGDAHRVLEAAAEIDRAKPRAADDSERLVDIICAMMAERSASSV